jgi:hypothetical protein
MQAHVDRNSKSQPSKHLWSFLGFLLYLAVGVAFLVGGFLFVPPLWLVPLWGGWLLGLWITYRLMSRRSWWTLAAAPLALTTLWAYLQAGWGMWGWAVEDLPFGGR